jgi:hypothetical protein
MNDRDMILTALAALAAIWYFSTHGRANGGASASPSCGSSCGGGCSSCSQGNSYQWNKTAPVNPTTATSSSLMASPVTTAAPAAGDLAGPSAPGSNARYGGSGANWQGLRTTAQSALTPPFVPNSPFSPTSNLVAIPYVNSARVRA